ncbi:MAG: hypothetical protein QG673_584 [Pseudomonadota bacterium]|nr:hypothetical protein [Pseudomonadota bacterium]
MRVLNFLITTKYNILLHAIVDYLIDRGHFVTVIDSEWLTKNITLNFKLMHLEDIVLCEFDYVIDTEHLTQQNYIPTIDFSFEKIGKHIVIEVLMFKQNRIYTLSTRNIVQDVLSKENIDDLCFEFKECFIDAIINLMRNEYILERHLKNTNNKLNTSFKELLILIEEFDELQKYYQSCNQNTENIFKIISTPDLATCGNYSSFVSASFKFNTEQLVTVQLEFLVIYLQMLLNGRKDGLYSYDFYKNDRLITKIIAAAITDTYKTLNIQINHSRYNLMSSAFYSIYSGNQRKAQVLLVEDENFNMPEFAYGLILHYNLKSKQLSIYYSSSLYFFDQSNLILEYFSQKFNLWIQNKLTLKDILYTDLSLYSRELYCNNNTCKQYSEYKTIDKLFEEQVERTPNNIALVCHGVEITYAELNVRANKLSHYLSSNYAIRGDNLVGLCIGRDQYMVIGILGILKAGGAYVPIDPDYPKQRISYILKDTQLKLIITDLQHRELLRQILVTQNESDLCKRILRKELYSLPHILCIDEPEQQEILDKCSPNNQIQSIKSSSLAYLIYTSGTTGNPKGVMVEHKSIVNMVEAKSFACNIKQLSKDNNMPLSGIFYANFVFDAHVWQMFAIILNGHILHILSGQVRKDILLLRQYVEEQQIYIGDIPPALLDIDTFVPLKVLVIGGDKIKQKILDKYCENKVKVINCYGPTECTVCSSLHHYRGINDLCSNIGKPIQNVQMYVLDHHLLPVPIGVIGELFIGGVGLARGYFNDLELTKERFIPNPFQTDEEKENGKNTTLYRTGDLVRYLPDANIEYISRNDSQVKIRGMRIELGEIENKLVAYPGVKQAVVVVKEDGVEGGGSQQNTHNKILIGYYVADTKLDEESVLKSLGEWLPDHMVPVALVYLKQLPLTTSGKFDIRALPMPRLSKPIGYIAPHTNLETLLVEFFAHALQLETEIIGISDSFFKLGGNSISAIKLIHEINRKLNRQIEIGVLYQCPTVKELSNLFCVASVGDFIYKDYQIKENDLNNLFEPFRLSNVQQAYLIGREASQVLGGVSTHIYFEVMYKQIDKNRLQVAVNLLIKRHIVLKSRFSDELLQAIDQKDVYYKIDIYNCNTQQDVMSIRDLMSHEVIPVTRIPLFNIAISYVVAIEQYIVHFSFDALLLDAVSIRIFLKELCLYYQNPNEQLPDLIINFRDYRKQYERIIQTNLYLQAQAYWLEKLDNYNFEMGLPLLIESALVNQPKFRQISKLIDKPIWNKIKLKAQHYQVSLTTIVLMAYGCVFTYWSNQKNICINLTLFNRLPLHEQINDIMGDFTLLELFNFVDERDISVLEHLKIIHFQLWNDIENCLFDGVELLRLIRQKNSIPLDRVIAPIVLTSILGEETDWAPPLGGQNGTNLFFTAQTPQVWIDNKAYETVDGFVAEWDYVEQLFSADQIEQMHSHYCYILEWLAITDWDKEKLPHLEVPAADYALIQQANIASMDVVEHTLFGYYEHFIMNNDYLDHIAVVDNSNEVAQCFTYRNLIDDSTFCAGYIFRQNNNKDLFSSANNLIGILVEKGYIQVVTCLGIMKAGYGYLPLSVEWPTERVKEVLDQAGVSVLLLSKTQMLGRATTILSDTYQIILIEDIFFENTGSKLDSTIKSVQNLYQVTPVKPTDIAYVIFTSGSTGKPKGVTITHQGALNTICAVNKKYSITNTDKILALSDLSFDLSVYDIFGMLSCGGTIVFPNQSSIKEPSYWIKLIRAYEITIWNSVPQLADLLIKEMQCGHEYIESLRLFLLSGDWIPVYLVLEIKRQLPQTQTVSLGGATEGSIWSIWYEINEIDHRQNSIPYGIAMPNQKMYVLNQYNQHCPVGVNGEIHIGGAGLALNYWHDEYKTNKSYFKHPILGRLYKTGDLGRWNRKGYIEFLGRLDKQVKINGYRIELGEIETKLISLPGISEAIVTVQKVKERNYLVSYLIANYTMVNRIKKATDKNTVEHNFRCGFHAVYPNSELINGYKLLINLDEDKYTQRKSYRKFRQNEIDLNILKNVINQTQLRLNEVFIYLSSNLSNLSRLDTNVISVEDLSKILSCLACMRLPAKEVPKYLYPSAGNSYAVRCYLSIANELSQSSNALNVYEIINKGYYYFNPLEHALLKVERFDLIEYNQTNNTIDLIVNRLSIIQLYGDNALRFAALEVGHMLDLIVRQLLSLRVSYTIVYYSNKQITDEDDLIVQIILGNSNTIDKLSNDASLLSYDSELMVETFNKVNPTRFDALSIQKDGKLVNNVCDYIDINELSIFDQASPYCGRVLESGKLFIGLYGENTVNNWIVAGMFFQELTEKLYEYDYGSCMLGDLAGINFLYCMVVGCISKTDKQSTESNLEYIPLKNYINNHLRQLLPEYMLPYDYMVITEKPLTLNGKLAINQLPKFEIFDKQDYVEPRTDLERKLSMLFADVLELNIEEIGLKTNFFKYGGNSLLAMQLVSKINTGISRIKIQDIYAHSTLEELAQFIDMHQDENVKKVLSYAEFRLNRGQ